VDFTLSARVTLDLKVDNDHDHLVIFAISCSEHTKIKLKISINNSLTMNDKFQSERREVVLKVMKIDDSRLKSKAFIVAYCNL
jgi:hypothetical protein